MPRIRRIDTDVPLRFVSKRELCLLHSLDPCFRGYIGMVIRIVGVIYLTSVVSLAAASESDLVGQWHQWTWSELLPRSLFRCTIQWQCSPIDDVLLGENQRLETSNRTNTSGVCVSTGGGKCDKCGAAPPSEECIVKVVTE